MFDCVQGDEIVACFNSRTHFSVAEFCTDKNFLAFISTLWKEGHLFSWQQNKEYKGQSRY